MKDLLTLYSFYSVHGTDGETQICDWLVHRLEELGIKDIQRKGNTIWHFDSNNTVMLSAHLDQVATNGPAKHFYKMNDGIIKAYNESWDRTSLGADDKNGIWIILKALEEGWAFDFIISEGEEVGCVGINNIEEHIKESKATYCIVLDRKGNRDILKGGSADVYCEALASNLKNYWNSLSDKNTYNVTTGSISDTRVICKYIESVNLSVNYEGAHTKHETTDWNALQQTLMNVIEAMGSFVHYPANPEDYCKKEYSYTRYTDDDFDLESYESSWRRSYYGGKKYGRY